MLKILGTKDNDLVIRVGDIIPRSRKCMCERVRLITRMCESELSGWIAPRHVVASYCRARVAMAVRAATTPSQDADHGNPPRLLTAKMDNARNLSCLLRAVQFREVPVAYEYR